MPCSSTIYFLDFISKIQILARMDTVLVQPMRSGKQRPGYLLYVILFLPYGKLEMSRPWLALPMPILPLIDINNGNEFVHSLFSVTALELSKTKFNQL